MAAARNSNGGGHATKQHRMAASNNGAPYRALTAAKTRRSGAWRLLAYGELFSTVDVWRNAGAHLGVRICGDAAGHGGRWRS